MDALETPLHKAVKSGNIQDVKALILNGVEINALDKFKRTPLYHAVFQNMATIVTILLQNGADPNVSILTTPLHIAARFGFLEIVKIFIAKDAKIDAKDSHGFTPLHWAIMKGRNFVLETLLQNGANIEAKDDSGGTPLHMAAYDTRGHAKTLEILIQNGAKLDAKDNQGQTPIHLAVFFQRSCRIEILVRYGASLKIRDNFGLTPFECALKRNQANQVLMEKKLKCLKALCYEK